MRLFRRLSHQPKGEENIKSDWSIYRILAPSVIGIFICAVCLCGVSWAWFTANVSVEATTIKTASYTVSVTAKDSSNNDITPTTNDDGAITVTFSSAGAYTVTITPSTGSNMATSGYCTIGFNDTTYYTGQLTSGSFSLTVNATENQTLTVTPQWGTYSGSGQIINSGGTIGTAAGNDDENASEELQSSGDDGATQEALASSDTTDSLAMESSSVSSSSTSDSSTESSTSESNSALTPSTSAQSETSDANSSFAQEVVTTEGKTAA